MAFYALKCFAEDYQILLRVDNTIAIACINRFSFAFSIRTYCCSPTETFTKIKNKHSLSISTDY